jgi:hypothetical protein
LASINSQLGDVGYVIAIEYGFYIYFALRLLCIVAVLAAERLRVAGRPGFGCHGRKIGALHLHARPYRHSAGRDDSLRAGVTSLTPVPGPAG